VQGPAGRRLFVAVKAARRGRQTGNRNMDRNGSNTESDAQPSPTAHLLDELQLYGYRPFADEPDPRPLPDEQMTTVAIADIFDAIVSTFEHTRLEPDLEPLLWATVNVFHGTIRRVDRELDRNEEAQLKSRREQDGSEIRSVELERLVAEGVSLVERRNAFENLRELSSSRFRECTGSQWLPRAGSLISRTPTLTSAVIDSRDFVATRRRVEAEPLLPPGPKVAITGGADYADHRLVWERLDRTRERHADMVLLHGGAPTGVDRIAACWAQNRRVPQIVFRPDWSRYGKAAPFRRNDALLDTLPIGLLAFPGNGINENLVDKARRLGIPVWRAG
jgi:hypothetical protein